MFAELLDSDLLLLSLAVLVAGIVIGAFTEGKPGDDGVSTEEVIAERLGDLGVPVIAGFPGGHIDDNEPLTFGAAARIDGDRFTISA